MFKKIFESCEDSIVKRVSNPYFGTYIAVLLIDNWELIYTLFTFSSYETRDARISIIAEYISQEGGLSWLFVKCALIAFIPFIIYYILLNASGYISNWFELRLKPWLLKQVDKGLVVDKAEYEKLAARITTLQTKVDDERKKRMEAEDERDDLNKKLMKIPNEQTSISPNINDHQEVKTPVNEVINDRKNKHYYQILADIHAKNLDDEFENLIHIIRLNEYIRDDEPIVKYGIIHNLIAKTGSRYYFTTDGDAIASIFVNTSLPDVSKSLFPKE
ncbi:hypothetical protein [Alistipes onderdonkii]|uniref:hypothetical protein n=1 Tax=Alistipes onderdonkii TaxID=328813 RepID=UPI00050A2B60|nr:hypothetical protein [Alistipes onderdonkii]